MLKIPHPLSCSRPSGRPGRSRWSSGPESHEPSALLAIARAARSWQAAPWASSSSADDQRCALPRSLPTPRRGGPVGDPAHMQGRAFAHHAGTLVCCCRRRSPYKFHCGSRAVGRLGGHDCAARTARYVPMGTVAAYLPVASAFCEPNIASPASSSRPGRTRPSAPRPAWTRSGALVAAGPAPSP